MRVQVGLGFGSWSRGLRVWRVDGGLNLSESYWYRRPAPLNPSAATDGNAAISLISAYQL